MTEEKKDIIKTSDHVYREGITGLREVVHSFSKLTGERVLKCVEWKHGLDDIETRVVTPDLRGKKKESPF